MIVIFTKELDKQLIYANGKELAAYCSWDTDENGERRYSLPDHWVKHLATFNNPVLFTDRHQINQLDYVKRETVDKLYRSPKVTTIFNGTSLTFEQRKYPGVWGPNIDTLFFCKGLDQKILEGVETAVEIGCGSGFISKYILEHGSNVKNIELYDINPYAIECAKNCIDDSRARFILGDAKIKMKGKKFDLIVCNPPYIPRPKSIDDNPYERLSLPKYLLDEHQELLNDGGKFITNISTVGIDLFKGFVEEAGYEMEIYLTKEVPFKILNVLNNKEWMNYLIKHRNLKEDYHDGHKYWHKINMIKTQKNESSAIRKKHYR